MSKPKSTPTGETKLHPKNPNETIMLYTDGTWRYDGNGKITKGALAIKPAWLTSFNKKTSVEAFEAKKDKRRETFKRGIVSGAKGVHGKTITDADEAFECVVEVRTEVALSGDPGSLADAKWLDEALYGNRKEDTPKIEIHIDNATLHAIQHVEDRNVIEGDFKEADNGQDGRYNAADQRDTIGHPKGV